MRKNQTVHLIVFCNSTLVGVAGLDMRDKAEKHVGEFGISIAQAYRGEGFGTLLMETVLKEAEANIPELQIIVLDVFSDNAVALAMYKKYGFIEYGRLPNAYLHDTVYVDGIKMYKNAHR